MSVAKEIREEQRKALSTMSPKEKLAYFWDYYKIHTVVAIVVAAFTVMFIHQYVTNKDYAFYATLINAMQTDSNAELSAAWAQEFQEYAEIDPDEYLVYIDTTVSLSDDIGSQYAISNREKMLAMMQIGTINAIVADTKIFEEYAQFEYFCNLDMILSPEELEKYRPYFYYTDAASFEKDNDDTYYDMTERPDPGALVIDHRDPASMEQPVAVGIVVSEDNLLADAGYYAYLDNSEYDYQGHSSEAVLGIPISCKQPEMAVKFLEYLKLGQN